MKSSTGAIVGQEWPAGRRAFLWRAAPFGAWDGSCTDPRLLLLDEPTAGMTPAETEATIGLIRRIARGRTTILVEHKMNVVMTVCDRISTFHQGRILAEGTPEEIRANRDVQAVYFGTG